MHMQSNSFTYNLNTHKMNTHNNRNLEERYLQNKKKTEIINLRLFRFKIINVLKIFYKRLIWQF